MAAQWDTSQSLVVEWGLLVFNALFVSNILEYRHKSYIAENYILWSIFADSMG